MEIKEKKMKIKIASNDSQSMAQSGDSILRSLQNTDFSYADIIVRESLQNSLDATLPESSDTQVRYNLGDFESEKLSPSFEQISTKLVNYYPGKQRFLAISDRGTTGLTGEYLTDDKAALDRSNFQKLVFSIGKNQDQDGAGGSWGMGKTSYFRIGCGIVIYYTRIRLEGNNFEERLVASLIENPKKQDRLLDQDQRGIAWWGTYGSEDPETLLPITDHDEIEKFLSIFGLEPYQANDTGTMIVIPYLQDNLTGRSEETIDVPWNQNFEDAIRMAIQRWYAPRLANPTYHDATGNSVLYCFVNDEPIYPLDPMFELMQDLYNAAATGESENSEINIQEVRLAKRAFAENNGLAGRVAFIQLQPDQDKYKLHLSPYSYVTSEGDEDNLPRRILAFTRKPGMIVKYDIDGHWTFSVKTETNLVAFFVPNSTEKMNKTQQESGFRDLEEYLRKSEKADHADWFDKTGVTVVGRITRNTAAAIREALKGEDANHRVHISDRLARRFSNLVPKAHGKGPSQHPSRTPGVKKEKTVHLNIDESYPCAPNKIKVVFSGYIRSKAVISLGIQSQDGRLTKAKWEKNFDKLEFPASISRANVKSVDNWESDEDQLVLESKEPTNFSGEITVKLTSKEYRVDVNIQQVK